MNPKQVLRTLPFGIIGTHLFLTMLNNFPDQHLSIERFSSLLQGQLPNWRFFGPNPGSDNLFLYYRTIGTGGEPSPWMQREVGSSRHWWAVIWNAGNRAPKALFDICQNIHQLSILSDGDFEKVKNSQAYEILRDYFYYSTSSDQLGCQFALLSSRPGPVQSSLEVVVVSELIERRR
ncbi:hypothetical protein [Leucobacter aridicollis]|uniref:hypothetical protein n=1 Tax=Leucobacter aridicollis TaxID=283878 RepID=UPI002169B6F2|nr:hypothetical protein [Leucobacter aridicollis]MCS3427178.1 hypothetical protein [Leucobacter aridicollis]